MDVTDISFWAFNLTGIAFFTVNAWAGDVILFTGYAQLGVYLALSKLYDYNQKKTMRIHPKHAIILPKVSVLISAYNEQNIIETCIMSILKSDYPSIEIVVVDDGSTDFTPAILDKLALSYKIKVMHKKNAGKAKGLNEAMKMATGEVIITMDADTSISRFAIKRLVKHFKNPKVGAVCGYDMPSNANNWLVKLLMLSSHMSTGLVRRALSTINCIPVVNFGAFKKSVLKKAGAYADTIGEDFEMTLRIHKLGYKIEFEPRAIAKSESPTTLNVLWHQRIRWFRGYMHGIRLHKDMLFRGMFGLFMVYNFISNVIFPWFLFIAFLFFLGAMITIGVGIVSINLFYLTISFFGLAPAFLVVCYALWLDKDLKKYALFLIVFPTWIIYSIFLDVVSMVGLLMEVSGRKRIWVPWVKTGIQTT